MKLKQAILEFLLNYGWAILIILVAGGALAYLGVLSPCKFYPKDSAYYMQKCIEKPAEKQTTRADMDYEALMLCENLRVNDKIYPEYQEKINLMQNSTPEGWVYIPESPNIIENKPRLLRTGIEDNPYKWTGNLSEIKTVFCLIPSEICFPVTTNITECGMYQDRMRFDYKKWIDWYEKNR